MGGWGESAVSVAANKQVNEYTASRQVPHYRCPGVSSVQSSVLSDMGLKGAERGLAYSGVDSDIEAELCFWLARYYDRCPHNEHSQQTGLEFQCGNCYRPWRRRRWRENNRRKASVSKCLQENSSSRHTDSINAASCRSCSGQINGIYKDVKSKGALSRCPVWHDYWCPEGWLLVCKLFVAIMFL